MAKDPMKTSEKDRATASRTLASHTATGPGAVGRMPSEPGSFTLKEIKGGGAKSGGARTITSGSQ